MDEDDEDDDNDDDESDDESEAENKNEGVYLLHNKPSAKVKNTPNKRARVSVVLSIQDKAGNIEKYLGILDTGSTGGVVSSELVEKYGFKCEKINTTWNTNSGNFKTRRTTTITNLRFPQFTNKRVIEKTSLYVNPNKKQQYTTMRTIS